MEPDGYLVDAAAVLATGDEAILECARIHTARGCADGMGVSIHRVLRLLRVHDGFVRGRGHPTLAELEARKPRPGDCICAMCRAVADAELAVSNRRHASVRRHGLLTLVPPELARGACKEWPAEWWFPVGTPDPGKQRPSRSDRRRMAGHYSQARAVCAICPVKDECRRFARANRIPDGMFGGEDPYERNRPVEEDLEAVAS